MDRDGARAARMLLQGISGQLGDQVEIGIRGHRHAGMSARQLLARSAALAAFDWALAVAYHAPEYWAALVQADDTRRRLVFDGIDRPDPWPVYVADLVRGAPLGLFVDAPATEEDGE